MIRNVRFRVESILITDYAINIEKFMDDLTEEQIKIMNLLIDHSIIQTREYILDNVKNKKHIRVIRNSLKKGGRGE